METPIVDLPTITAGTVLALAVPIFAVVFGAEMVKSARRTAFGTVVLLILGTSLLTNCGGLRTRAEAGLETIKSVEPAAIDARLNDPATVRNAIANTQSVANQLAVDPQPGAVPGVDTPVTVIIDGVPYSVTAEELPLWPMKLLEFTQSRDAGVLGVTITRADVP